ncbi:PQQ-like beta-propeller repeat protein [bacterium]|nr:PQQ-like beta-propeller repeat protein [bacterium]
MSRRRTIWLAAAGVGAIVPLWGAALLIWPGDDPKLLWKSNMYPGGMMAGAAPGELVLVGSDAALDVNFFSDATVVGFDGQVRWRFVPQQLNETGKYTAVGDDGSIYVGTDKNNVYAFNPSGKLRWVFPAKGDRVGTSCPALGPDGTLYVTASDGIIYAVNADGSMQWRKELPGLNGGYPPVVSPDGTIYATSMNWELISITPTGKEQWRSAPSSVDVTAPLFSEGGLIICVRGFTGDIVAYKADGEIAWNYIANMRLAYDLVLISGDILFVCDNDPILSGKLLAIDTVKGVLLWSRPCDKMFTKLSLASGGQLCIVSSPFPTQAQRNSSWWWISNMLVKQNVNLTVISQEGEELKRKRLKFFFPLTNLLAPPDGTILVLGSDGILYCYEI